MVGYRPYRVLQLLVGGRHDSVHMVHGAVREELPLVRMPDAISCLILAGVGLSALLVIWAVLAIYGINLAL